MGKLAQVLALLAVSHAVAGRPAAATVNVTGTWFLDAAGTPLTGPVDFAQSGSTLVEQDPVTMTVVLSGTIDSTTGAFALSGSSGGIMCPDNTFEGAFAADGNTLTGTEQVWFIGFGGCTFVPVGIRGHRTFPGCGDGISQPYCVPFSSDCRVASASRKVTLSLKSSPHPGRSGLAWKWSGADPAAPGDFGSPDSDDAVYSIAIFDRSTPTPTLILGAISTTDCFPKACWKQRGRGFTYRVGDEQPSGPDQITLKTGSAGTALVQVRGTGGQMFLPVLPLQSTDLTVQARSSSGICWQADYDATGVVANDPGKFKARSR